jgi:hypothetical protein
MRSRGAKDELGVDLGAKVNPWVERSNTASPPASRARVRKHAARERDPADLTIGARLVIQSVPSLEANAKIGDRRRRLERLVTP